MERIHYDERYDSVVRFTSIVTLLALVYLGDLEPHQMYVVTSLLNVERTKEIDMEQTDGFTYPAHPNHVFLIFNSI